MHHIESAASGAFPRPTPSASTLPTATSTTTSCSDTCSAEENSELRGRIARNGSRSKCWVRRSVSALLLLLVASAHAQDFGRFGYEAPVEIPHFAVDVKGFRIKQDRADLFGFETTSRIWKAVQTSSTEQTILLTGGGRSPVKVRFDLHGSGFSLFFRKGISFRLSSTQAPYLTWSEGSVGSDVPTPSAQWLIVSFRDSQPPLLISMLSGPASFELKGKSGAWRLNCVQPYEGWIRVSAPFGLAPMATNSAAALGSLKARVAPLLKYLTGPVPKLLKLETTEQEGALTANWIYDRPYALVPLPAVLASLGGYPLKLESSSFRIDSTDPSGPLSVLTENVMRIRFPIRRVPTGRALALGAPKIEPLATVSTIDLPSIGELALSNLSANRDVLVKETAEEVLGQYLSEVDYSVEPNTNQRLPFRADGSGLDLAAAH